MERNMMLNEVHDETHVLWTGTNKFAKSAPTE